MLAILGTAVKHEFQAETRQLLDIVARSLYSEKEVYFINHVSSNTIRYNILSVRKLLHFDMVFPHLCLMLYSQVFATYITYNSIYFFGIKYIR